MVVGFTVTVSVVGVLGRISTPTVPVMVPLMAVMVSRAGDVAEKTVKLVTVKPFTKVTAVGIIVPVVSLMVMDWFTVLTVLLKESTARIVIGKDTPAVCGVVACKIKPTTAPGVKVATVVPVMVLVTPAAWAVRVVVPATVENRVADTVPPEVLRTMGEGLPLKVLPAKLVVRVMGVPLKTSLP